MEYVNATGYAGSSYPTGQALSGPSPQTDESASRIRDGITRAEELLSQVHEAILLLEKRLDTVLSPVPPSVAGNSAAKAQTGAPISHLLGRITILNEGFDHAAQRVRDLTRRVEV